MDVMHMDAPSHYFFSLERRNGQRKIFHSLSTDTRATVSDPDEICRSTAGFYKDLYKSDNFFERALPFFEGLPQVQTNNALEEELTAEELQAAVLGLKNGKAPGIDGLPADFYKSFWSVIGGDVLDVLRDSLVSGCLPLSCRRAVITLFPKKGDLQQLKNWRPVSLLCTDYKLLSKVLATRLGKVMAEVIHVDQSYCVPGRLITDNVMLIRDFLEVSGSLGVETGLISIDQEKAFDRVEHHYLWHTLQAFGFSPGFIAMIQVLYRNIESMLKINGGLSAPFKVQRCVRQGCSLSGMLYSLAIEPLLHRLRKELSGIVFPGCNGCFNLSAYADDVVVFIKSQKDVSIMENIINDFSLVSFARVNWGKSEALAVGEVVATSIKLPGGLVWKKGGIKYLGVFVRGKD